MTFHSSKGLDFKSVFIPLMNDDAKVVRKASIEMKTQKKIIICGHN